MTQVLDLEVAMKGQKALLDMLNSVGKKLRDKIIREEIRKAMRPIHMASIAAAPRRTGNLAASIKLRSGKSRTKNTVGAMRIFIDPTKLKMMLVKPHEKRFAGGFIERHRDPNRRNPFMRRTFISHRDSAIRDAMTGILSQIEKVKQHGS